MGHTRRGSSPPLAGPDHPSPLTSDIAPVMKSVCVFHLRIFDESAEDREKYVHALHVVDIFF